MKRQKVLHVATKYDSDFPGLFNTKQREVLRKKQMTGVLPDATSSITDGMHGQNWPAWKNVKKICYPSNRNLLNGGIVVINISNIPYSSCK